MANFVCEFFDLAFSGSQAPPKNSPPKFTPRIVGIPLQFHFLKPQIYSRRFSAYWGDPILFYPGVGEREVASEEVGRS